MKFNRLLIPQHFSNEKGISEINLQRLGNVVAFVGRNGSGKTRILDLIEENAFESMTIYKLVEGFMSSLPDDLEEIRAKLKPYKKYLHNIDKLKELQRLLEFDKYNNKLKLEIRALKREVNSGLSFSNEIDEVEGLSDLCMSYLNAFKKNNVRRIKRSEIGLLQQAISGGDASLKFKNLSFEKLIANVATESIYNELNSINESALQYLTALPHELVADNVDCLLDGTSFEEMESYKRFSSLKKIMQSFLNKELSWERLDIKRVPSPSGVDVRYQGIWKLNGRLFNYNELSDGEKMLFAYALLFFLLDLNPGLSIKESIILIDEPELHLHADSEIKLMNGLRDIINEKGQLIIATHSVNILSSLNYEEIFMVKEGVIKHPSQATPGQSLLELMNLEDRINKLSDFLSSIENWAYVNFMAQCFTNPEVIEISSSNDPQIGAFKQSLKNSASKRNNMLLDFGAGKGRVFEQIATDDEFMKNFTYSALEPDEQLHLRLISLKIENVYKRYNELPKSEFDFILICNVLHEIPVKDWKDTINGIIQSLNDEGYLIVIEAKNLNKGEKIGEIGFLALDLEELKVLFDMELMPVSIAIPGKEDSTVCAVIPKTSLKLIGKEQVIQTLEALEINTLKKIKELRMKEYGTNELLGKGRKSAFLSQLHLNSKFALEFLRGETVVVNSDLQ